MRISVLGMGNMGRAVAGRLVDHGHEVTVWNRTQGRATGLVDRGATEAASVGTATSGAEVALVSVRDDAAARDVLASVEGAPVVVNCTTSAPAATAELAAMVASYVAAPILGAPMAVAEGTAAYVVAGPVDAVERLEPLWPALTTRVVHAGTAPERASIVKVVNNHLLLTGLVALSEAVAVAQAAGLEDGVITDLLATNPMVAPGLRNRFEDMVSGDHDGWFAMPLGAKDLGLFVDLGVAHGLDPRLAERARDRYLQAASAGWEEADVAGVVELLRAATP